MRATMVDVDVTASLRTQADPSVLYEVVSDLSTYPQWLDIVPRAEPVAADATDPGPAWSVDLRGQVGPLRRSKRLRMVRTRDVATSEVVFERAELDGRRHSDWILRARIEPADDETTLTMSLHYGGSLWVPLLDRLLADEIERSRPRLSAVVEQR